MKEIKLDSGAVLKMNLAPFAESKALYQALMKEIKSIKINSKMDMAEIVKDLLCVSFSSPEIEAALLKCMERCQYCDKRGDLKIDKDTFEPVEAREDYLKVCVEVGKENLLPFMKSLFASYQQAIQMIGNTQA